MNNMIQELQLVTYKQFPTWSQFFCEIVYILSCNVVKTLLHEQREGGVGKGEGEREKGMCAKLTPI